MRRNGSYHGCGCGATVCTADAACRGYEAYQPYHILGQDIMLYTVSMRPLLVCNWKTYVPTERAAVTLAEDIGMSEKAAMVACPSALHIASVRDTLKEKNIHLGAQDISVSHETPQTGRLSGDQLRDAGVRYVLAGHAETRANGVTNVAVAAKTAHALVTDVKPIICLSEQEKKEQQPGDEVVAQLEEILKITGNVCDTIVAYEPTAYIGAATALDTATIKKIITRLRMMLTHCDSVPILYGGSVDADNAADILQNGGADGFLIGRAGVDARKMNTILSVL